MLKSELVVKAVCVHTLNEPHRSYTWGCSNFVLVHLRRESSLGCQPPMQTHGAERMPSTGRGAEETIEGANPTLLTRHFATNAD
jgi:hypothetical protein